MFALDLLANGCSVDRMTMIDDRSRPESSAFLKLIDDGLLAERTLPPLPGRARPSRW